MKSHHQTRISRPNSYSGTRRSPVLPIILCVLVAVCVLLFAAMEIVIGLHAKTSLTRDPQVIVVFGCKVEPHGPSVLLQDRLNTALDYWQDHPDVKLVVTGGQGKDEHMSEAQAMYNYLTEKGVSSEQIYMEDRARNTWQNVNYTMDLLEGLGIETNGTVAAVSSGFHLARIEMLWDRAGGGELVGVLAAPVSHVPSAIQMFFREPLALIKSFLVDR